MRNQRLVIEIHQIKKKSVRETLKTLYEAQLQYKAYKWDYCQQLANKARKYAEGTNQYWTVNNIIKELGYD